MGVSVENAQYVFRIEQLREVPASIRFVSCEPLLGPLPDLNLTGIGWVIAGAESGVGARQMLLPWVRDLRDQCRAASVPLFFKLTAPSWWLIMPLFVSKERAADLRQHLTEGRLPIPQTGAVVAVTRLHPPFVVVDGQDVEVVAVTGGRWRLRRAGRGC